MSSLFIKEQTALIRVELLTKVRTYVSTDPDRAITLLTSMIASETSHANNLRAQQARNSSTTPLVG